MTKLCYINGKVLPLSEASVAVTDLGLQRGYGVFDFGRITNNHLFHFKDHLARFRNSAAALHLEVGLSDQEITDIAHELMSGSKLERPAIKLLLTCGPDFTPPFNNPTFIMMATDMPAHPADVYENGASIITTEYLRELPTIKSTNYLNAIRLEPLRLKHKAFDILYYWQNLISECPRSNVFVFQGDRLLTPQDGVLHGVTRGVVMKLAEERFSAETKNITLDQLFSADEVFLTSSTKDIIPVVTVDGKPIGDGKIGERTRYLMAAFETYKINYTGESF